MIEISFWTPFKNILVLSLLSIVLFVVLWIIFALFVLFTRIRDRSAEITLASLWAILPISIVAIIVGYLTANSRAPAVDALVPAVLTLIGGAFIYLIGKGPLRGIQVSAMMLAFALNLFVGAGIGAQVRERTNLAYNSVDALKAEADRDFQIMLYRRALGLPPYQPKTTAAAE